MPFFLNFPKKEMFEVIGGSFIGMEVASSLAKKGCDVAVIAMETVPFERVLGKKVAWRPLPKFWWFNGVHHKDLVKWENQP